MRANVLVMLALAVVFGIGAVFLSNIWLVNQEPRAAVIGPGAEPQSTIVVAAEPLTFGDRLTRDSLREIPWSANALPAGSYRTIASLLDPKAGDRQVLSALAANEPILSSKITGPGQRATLSAVLDKGMSAVSIRVNDQSGVAGFVLPGDRVNILLQRHSDNQSFVDVLLQNVKVLAIDQIADDKKENPIVARSVTVEVSTLDAQKLTLAAGVGQLSLALRQIGSGTDQATERVTLGDLSADNAIAQPAMKVAATAPAAEPVVKPPVRPTTVSVSILRGNKWESYDVPVAQ